MGKQLARSREQKTLEGEEGAGVEDQQSDERKRETSKERVEEKAPENEQNEQNGTEWNRIEQNEHAPFVTMM